MIIMFITFEGGEGSGKTSLIKEVESFFKKQNKKVFLTREPGGSFVAEQIRNIILDNKNEMSPKTEALLFAASRVEHLETVILKKLAEGYLVLCDRFIDSSLAYQGYARGLGFEEVLKINHFASKNMPDYTIYIDSDPQEGLKRALKREKANRLDKESLLFHEKVKAGYQILIKKYPQRYLVVNGQGTMEELIADTLMKLKEIFL
ncbi:MAG TPA: dTMP kinase [Acholeplasmataceae bacterium]|nr:dTMP kinase [Acholeplasmataceae bacterium]